MASSESDQKLIKYVAMKAQNLNRVQSRPELGINNPQKLIENVEKAITQQEEIKDALWNLAAVQASAEVKASLADTEEDKELTDLQDSDSDSESEQSDMINEFESDSESDNPDDYVGVASTTTQKAKAKVRKISSILLRRTQRSISKKIANKSLLKRRLPKAVSRILSKYPNIGRVMEDFVHVLQLFLFCVCMLPVRAFVMLNLNGNDRRIWTCVFVWIKEYRFSPNKSLYKNDEKHLSGDTIHVYNKND